MRSDAFRAAVEAEDPDSLTDALADDVVFRSPVVFKAYEGKPVVSMILTEGAMRVFEDFRYVEQLEDGDAAALIFKARVGDRELDGLDLLRFDANGKVSELMVMVRPMSGLNALADAMGREFERLGITAPAGASARPAGE
jgi:SnoaL-like domain